MPLSRRWGGEPHFVGCKVPPRHGSLSREVLAINMVMAGCKPEYAPVVRAAMLALTVDAFNLNGVQATTHMAAPLLIVNGPIAREIGMNGDCNAFGSGNRANATIGRALRLVLLNVGGGWPGELDKSTLGHPGKYTYCVAENEMASPWAPYHVEKGFSAEDSTVFVLAAEPPHSVTNHVANDPEGILDSIASAMSTIANNNAEFRSCRASTTSTSLWSAVRLAVFPPLSRAGATCRPRCSAASKPSTKAVFARRRSVSTAPATSELDQRRPTWDDRTE